jgi:hypothetical protein
MNVLLLERVQADSGWLPPDIPAILQNYRRAQVNPGLVTEAQLDPGFKTETQLDPGYLRGAQVDPS